MKTRLTLFAALLMLAYQPIAAQAQNLFRTGRPDYARVLQPNTSNPNTYNYWNRVWDGGTLDRPSANRTFDPNLQDYERLQSAWNRYRREALRYQDRHGTAPFLSATNRSSTSGPGYGSSDYWADYTSRGNRRSPTGLRPVSAERCQYSQQRAIERDYEQDYGRGAADNPPRLPPTLEPSPYRETVNGSSRGRPASDFGPRLQSRPRLEPVPMGRRWPNGRSPSDLSTDRSRHFDPARTASRSRPGLFSSFVSE